MDIREGLKATWEMIKLVATFFYGYWMLKVFKHMFDIGVLP